MELEGFQSSSSVSDDDGMMKDQFIFTLGEFEGTAFDASAFVAKYRRVATLDSLRSQLRQYSEAIKSQLFVIINRDYRDFITIATKLDGVDTRVDILRRPLLDLRLDLHSLHDGLVGSLRAIDSKLQRRNELHQRKAAVGTALRCAELLDVAEEALNNNTEVVTNDRKEKARATQSEKISRRRQMLSVLTSACSSGSADMEYIGLAASSASAFSGVGVDIARASELERSAFSLRRAQVCLSSLRQTSGQWAESSASDDATFSLASTCAELDRRARAVSESLAKTARGWLDELLSVDSRNTSASGVTNQRVLMHCLRALRAIDRTDVAQAAVQAAVVPLARAQLSQGRVGGALGRGSFSGLSESLQGLVLQLKPLVESIVVAAEFMAADEELEENENVSASNLDLLVRGVWSPVIRTILERFPDIVSLAIPETLHSCYSAITAFTVSLPVTLLGDQMSPKTVACMQSHPLVRELESRWGLDLYFTMRLNEIVRRVDSACDDSSYAFTSTEKYTPEKTNVIRSPGQTSTAKEIGSVSNTGKGKGNGDYGAYSENNSASVRLHQGLVNSTCLAMYSTVGKAALGNTLSAAAIATLRRDNGIDEVALHLPLSTVIAVEMCTCLHASVVLPSLALKFLELALRLLLRLEMFVVSNVDVTTPRNVNGSSSCSGLVDSAGVVIQAVDKRTQVPALAQVISPAKGNISAPVTPMHGGNPPNLSSNGSNGPTVDDLAFLSADLWSLEQWVEIFFQPIALAALSSNDGAAGVKFLIKARVAELRRLRSAVLGRLQSMLAYECKSLLSSGGANVAGPVRAIASRYRMTNKPSPEAPSAYVETVLRPLKAFLKKHSAMLARVLLFNDSVDLSAMTTPLQWTQGVLDSISQTFTLHVQSLLETVRAMDSTLQSRRKILQLGEGTGAMSDSEKISLQVQLDVKAYAVDIHALLNELGGTCVQMAALEQLLVEVSSATQVTA